MQSNIMLTENDLILELRCLCMCLYLLSHVLGEGSYKYRIPKALQQPVLGVSQIILGHQNTQGFYMTEKQMDRSNLPKHRCLFDCLTYPPADTQKGNSTL